MIPKIPGDRIILRQLTKSDAMELYRYCKNKDVLRDTGIPFNPYELKHAEGFIKKTHSDHRKKTGYHHGIEYRNSKKIIGVVSLVITSKFDKSAELGYWLGRKYWGKGLMAEAIRLYLRFGFKELRLNRIHAGVFSFNIRSQKLLEKLGFVYEGCLRKSKKSNNRWRDLYIYSMLREEY
jgi:RimJ/RimL family protein N-acetyltransferase